MAEFEITYSLLSNDEMLKAILLMNCRNLVVNEILLQKLAYITGENPENIRMEVNEAAAKRAGDIFARIMVSTDNEAVEKRLNDIMKDQDLGKIDEED